MKDSRRSLRIVNNSQMEFYLEHDMNLGPGKRTSRKPSYPVVWVLSPEGRKPCDWGDVIQMPENG